MIKTTTKEPIKIITWNARSLKNKVDELQNYLIPNDIDIACIQETWLTRYDKTYIPGYVCIRKDKTNQNNPNQRTRGGLCIYVKQKIQYKRIPANEQIKNIDSLGIKIETGQSKANIFSIYLGPTKQLSYTELDHLLSDNHTLTILAGDWNSKHRTWNNTVEDAKGRKIAQYIDRRGYQIITPTNYTHIPENKKHRPSTIDFFIVKNNTATTQATATSDLSSDHNPVLLKINRTIELTEKLHFKYKKANWDKFEDGMKEYQKTYHEIPLTTSQIEIEIKTLTKAIKKQIEECIPKGSIKINTYEIDEKTKKIITIRNRARKLWQNTRNPNLKTLQNRLSQRIKYRINRLKQEYLENEIKKLDVNDNTLWKNISKFENKTLKINNIKVNNVSITNDSEIANALAENYEKIYQGNEEHRDEEFEEEVRKEMENIQNEIIIKEEMVEYTNKTEIKEIIRTLKNRKAPGEEGIQGIVIKNLPDNIIEILEDIYNSAILHSHFPNIWKNARIIPIKKPNKDPTQPSSYRPISLLPILSKIFEKIILKRLSNLNIKLTQDEQCGFKKGHSTTHQLCRLVQDVSQGFTNKKKTLMILLDIEKAFDKIWKEGLSYKLKKLQIPTHLVRLIHHYMTNRTFQVTYNNNLSDKREAKAGVIQGSVLGPVLFNIFISDLPTTKYLKKVLFADDTALYRTGNLKEKEIKLIQQDLNKYNDYYKKWKIKINDNKTEGIIFSMGPTDGRNINKPTFNKAPIEWKKQVKYLGTILDRRLTWNENTKYMRNKARIGLGKIYRLINPKSKLKRKLKLLLYKSLIRPVMTYASPAWINASKSQHKTLQRVQNGALKTILKKERTEKENKLHQEGQIETLKEFQNRLIVKFAESTKNNENTLIKNLGNYNPHKLGKRLKYKSIYSKLLILPNKNPFTLRS